ncbi:MAG: glycosyl hydrolase family 28-related protein [Pirellulaceae bacterium]
MKPNQSPTSRRAALTQLGAAGALVGMATLGRTAEPTPTPVSTGSPSYGLNVRDCGATGDGSTDDTAAFGQALDTVGKAGDGIVFVPTGNYRIQGHLSVPNNVTLEGVFRAPTARSQYRGSTLLAVEGRGQADGEPFVFLHANSVLKGVTIFYPEQDAQKPVPYPWCVRASATTAPSWTCSWSIPGTPWTSVLFPVGGISFAGSTRRTSRRAMCEPPTPCCEARGGRHS